MEQGLLFKQRPSCHSVNATGHNYHTELISLSPPQSLYALTNSLLHVLHFSCESSV
uniref:Uncharacterized protein n=1 Tax=Anguilla anguilla TaxID=7936 RepID=A0A0E9RSR8_ANGAN